MASKDKRVRIVLTLENCLIPAERLENTPSRIDGLSTEDEMDIRIVACEMIQNAGVLLRLPQVAMATAQVIFQRYFYRKSLVKHSFEHLAMACLFLAAKIEEAPRRIRDVTNVFHHIKQFKTGRLKVLFFCRQKSLIRAAINLAMESVGMIPCPLTSPHTITEKLIEEVVIVASASSRNFSPLSFEPMSYIGQTYAVAKTGLITSERRVLKELGFCCYVKHSHKLITTFLQILEHEKNSKLIQRAWNYMNDSLRSNVFLRFPPETIACACIHLAAAKMKVILPSNPPWYWLFDASLDDIQLICFTILSLYERKQRSLAELEETISKAKKCLSTAPVSSTVSAVNSPAVQAVAVASSPSSRKGSPAVSTAAQETREAKSEESRRDEEVAVADKPRSPPTKHSSGSSRENRRSRSPSTGRRGKRSRSRSSNSSSSSSSASTQTISDASSSSSRSDSSDSSSDESSRRKHAKVSRPKTHASVVRHRERSPHRHSSNSPNSDHRSSPHQYERRRSPGRYVRERSPRRYNRERSPHRYDRERSPRERSPRRYNRERSPHQNGHRSRSPRNHNRVSGKHWQSRNHRSRHSPNGRHRRH